LLTHRQTDRQTKSGKNIISLAEVKIHVGATLETIVQKFGACSKKLSGQKYANLDATSDNFTLEHEWE